jgi:serine/threonine protein kinase
MYIDMTQEWTPKTANQTASQAQPVWHACPTCNLNLESTVNKCPRDGTVLADLTDLGQTELLFDRQYEMLSVIASGGMGTVYKAIKRSLSKTVAIKMLKTQDTSTSMFARFRQEAYTASLLSHPNIIGIDDFGITSDGQPFMVMDFIEGADLSSLIKSQGRLKPADAIAIFVQIVGAMEHAHSKGILHRDLKPSNVMLANSPTPNCVKIVDFGIAKFVSGAESQHLTQTGELFGSPYYMSPEQTVGKAVDHRADIYAVGCIMYEALAGEVPIAGNTAFETLMKHMSEKPIPIQERQLKENISEGLQKLIMKALEKDAGLRQQSMAELKASLESVPEAIGKKPSPFSLSSTSYGVTPRTKKVLLASIIAVLLLAGASSQIAKTKMFNDLAMKPSSKSKSGGFFAFGSSSSSDVSPADHKQMVKPLPLERPEVTWKSLDNEDLKNQIVEHPDITDLCLDGCTVDNKGAGYLSRLNLTHIELSQCPQIKAEGYRAIIDSQPHLQSLIIAHTGTTSVDDAKATSTDDNIISELKNLRELKSLALVDMMELKGNDLAQLPKTLDSLSIAKNKRIPTNKIAELAGYTNLKSLDLTGTLVSDATLAKLTAISGLKSLRLNECPIGDDAIDSVVKFKSLEQLGLRKTLVSGDGFLKLTALPHLSEVDVTEAGGIKPNDAMKFQRLIKQRFCAVVPFIEPRHY